MISNLKYQRNYNGFSEVYQLKLPLELGGLIPDDDSVRLLSHELEGTKQTPYIKPQTYEKWKKRSFKKDISKRENMRYLEEGDVYVCHNNRLLWPSGMKRQKSASGYCVEVTVYKCEDCSGCEYREKCTKAKTNKKLYLSICAAWKVKSEIGGSIIMFWVQS